MNEKLINLTLKPLLIYDLISKDTPLIETLSYPEILPKYNDDRYMYQMVLALPVDEALQKFSLSTERLRMAIHHENIPIFSLARKQSEELPKFLAETYPVQEGVCYIINSRLDDLGGVVSYFMMREGRKDLLIPNLSFPKGVDKIFPTPFHVISLNPISPYLK